MKRKLMLVGAAAIAIGAWVALYRSDSAPSSRATAPSEQSALAEEQAEQAEEPELVQPPAPEPPPAAFPRSGKPLTESRAALVDSRPPVVAGLSIDRQGSPREQLLLAKKRRLRPDRDAQLSRLSGRTRARIEALRSELETAQGADRERLEQELAVLEKNDAWRSRILATTVRSDSRPGSERP
jgi:hypothetical protein